VAHREGTRKEALLSRVRRLLATVVTSVLLLGMMVTPAFAFIHEVTPVDKCANAAAGDNAGENGTAERRLEDNLGLGDEESIVNAPAPEDVPCR
jgi:hypothetical protein